MKQRKLTILLLFLGIFTVHAQNTIRGNVTDNAGMPLPGVTIIIKGTNKGASTDFDGNYSIDAETGDTLEFSYIGYISQSKVVGNLKTINVVFQEDTQELNEVVVIGYGTSSKKKLVSAVSSVKAEEINSQPVVRVDQALQGRAAGVQVTSNGGNPGSASTIRIRGNSSINGNNSPLYVIDGFIVGEGFNLNNISINDIESLEVLKDATALAIYGTRGASGVIIITTKSGKGLPLGKPTFSVNYYTSYDTMANKVDVLSGQDYVDYINEYNKIASGNPNEPELFEDGFPTTDWIDEVTTRGVINNVDLSVTGRTENTNYYASVGYFNQEGIVKNSGIERVTLRTNFDVNVSEKFKFGTRLNLSSFKKENNKVDFPQMITTVLPVRPIYDEDGNYTGTDPIRGNQERNPVADYRLRVDHDLVTNLIANIYGEYELFPNFKLKQSIGATLNFYKNNFYASGMLPDRIASGQLGGRARVNSNQTKDLLSETTFTWDKEFGNHSINILGGFTAQKITSEGLSASGEGFPNDIVKFNNLSLGSEPSTYQIGSGYNQRTLTSLLSRVTYGYNDKYILTLVGRQDGSSVFDENNKYAFFPSAGIAWNVDEEAFLNNSNTFNKLKLRASYGLVGEQGIDAYNSFNFLSDQFTAFDEQQVPGVIIGRPATQGLKWETTTQLDLGLEVGLLNNRINFEAGYYHKTTEDLLLRVDKSGIASNTRLLENVGSVENKGFEFLLNTRNISSKEFTWNTTFTLSTNKAKVLDIGDEEFINLQFLRNANQGGPILRLIPGEAFPVFVGAEYLGTYKTQQELIDDGQETKEIIGGPRFRDLDGNGIINENDVVVLGSPQPDFYGGLRNTFSYKGLNLDIFFQYSFGGEIYNEVTQRSFFGRDDENLDPRVLDRWIEGINETSNIPRAGSSSDFRQSNSVNVEDGTFVRLRTVTLSYDIPLKSSGLDKSFKSINVYVTGQNLLLISDFSLGDPEVNRYSGNGGFGSISQGVATGQYPYPRSIVTGLKINF